MCQTWFAFSAAVPSMRNFSLCSHRSQSHIQICLLYYYLDNSFSKKPKQVVRCALMIWLLLYTQHTAALSWLKKRKEKVQDSDCTKPIIKLWSCKHELWFKRTEFHSLSAAKGSTQLSIKTTVQVQTAGILLLFHHASSVCRALKEPDRHESERWPTGHRLSRHRGTLHSTGTCQMVQTQAVTNGCNFQLFIMV